MVSVTARHQISSGSKPTSVNFTKLHFLMKYNIDVFFNEFYLQFSVFQGGEIFATPG